MPHPWEKDYGPVLDAIAFAARAHRAQIRKDGATPYVSHVFRVCFIVRDVFGVDDRQALAAAALHDTVEDTTTDFDDLEETFGKEVAGWVAALSKDKRLAWDEREAAYQRALSTAPWQVQVCKLADVLDNTIDAATLPPEKRGKAFENARRYLTALKSELQPEARKAWETVARAYEDATGSEGHFGLPSRVRSAAG